MLSIGQEDIEQSLVANDVMHQSEELACRSFNSALHTKRKMHIAKLVSRIVAISNNVEPEDIWSSRRGTADIARARQVSAYLLHTGLSMSLTEIAALFDRDRTTIGHACRLVEDLRDCLAFDEKLTSLEETVHLIHNGIVWSGCND